ncbi:geranylgeranyl transferas-like protein type i beta subunit [Westerdykella ornata]|uniref:Geranylgeranyl transferas-like protein type i beta subunit n=1 Tax=Westerdykella ornata TaxID=318751 RepID=A0A6A6JW46_WESOR|nr:geranylgeranyl transferas-like protein type i beta subunit [Westerdykella ornata]KAF2280822.1 geranylgeranyl transferas-like protein type i beta subunit [Westerdykella ornata]
MAAAPEVGTILHFPRHVKYWRRNLKTHLPTYYTENDTNRMMLAFFTLSAEEILGDLDAALSPEERQGYIDWIYHCQLPEGGFRSSPATDLGTARDDKNAVWDPPELSGTFGALLSLAILGDDLQRVKRKGILRWLSAMQRPDGSFGQILEDYGRPPEGGYDPRFCYMAAGIRWILRSNVEGPVEGVPDIDVDKLVQCIRERETYNGGIAAAPFREAHAGYTSCAISALSLVDRLPLQSSQPPDTRLRGLTKPHLTLRWLVSRQTLTLDNDDAIDTHGEEASLSATYCSGSPPSDSAIPELPWVGINGRCCKIADTCYSYYVCTSLHILGHLDLVNAKPIRRWLLDRTQHLVLGGFGKTPGDYPDILHAYLGLFTLALFGEPGLRPVWAPLSISQRVKEHIESLPWRKQVASYA